MKTSLAALALLLCSKVAAAEELVRLERLEAQALSRRAALEVERARLQGARSSVDLARSGRRPRVGLQLFARGGPGGQLIRVRDVNGNEYLTQGTPPISGDDIPWVPRFGYGAAVSAEQRIYDFGRTTASIDAAEAETEGASASMEAARDKVVREVRSAYLTWLSATLVLRGSEGGLQRARQRRVQVQGRVAEGLRPASDAEDDIEGGAASVVTLGGATQSFQGQRVELLAQEHALARVVEIRLSQGAR
ncbi:MAG TPA: TolC family protein, partial [Polyangiaceae bacterium]|nr:TolC family protein [Polyangiaceae bacterium]